MVVLSISNPSKKAEVNQVPPSLLSCSYMFQQSSRKIWLWVKTLAPEWHLKTAGINGCLLPQSNGNQRFWPITILWMEEILRQFLKGGFSMFIALFFGFQHVSSILLVVQDFATIHKIMHLFPSWREWSSDDPSIAERPHTWTSWTWSCLELYLPSLPSFSLSSLLVVELCLL